MMQMPSNIIISRVDSIGDVVLTLPVAGAIKKYFPQTKIAFLCQPYAKPIVQSCAFVDEIIELNNFMQHSVSVCGQKPQAILHVLPKAAIAWRAVQLKIPLRIGTTNRLFHWPTCNKLVKLSRKNSSLHEAQLNLRLLEPFGISQTFSFEEITDLYGITKIEKLGEKYKTLLSKKKFNLILHPKSQGNGREWPPQNFIELIKILDKEKFKIFISGTEKEKPFLQEIIHADKNIIDITGQMSLPQFISFIHSADALVASGTGPLHIAAALGKNALGIFPPIKPVHPGRWQPIGKKAFVFVQNKICSDCKNTPANCACITAVQPQWLQAMLNSLYLQRQQQ